MDAETFTLLGTIFPFIVAIVAVAVTGWVITTWYDTWRIVDGKADEHWDSAVKQ